MDWEFLIIFAIIGYIIIKDDFTSKKEKDKESEWDTFQSSSSKTSFFPSSSSVKPI